MGIKCINCGKEIEQRVNRYNVCDCGYTELVADTNELYITSATLKDEGELVLEEATLDGCKRTTTYELDKGKLVYGSLHAELICKQVERAKEHIDNITEKLNSNERDFLSKTPAWTYIAYYHLFKNNPCINYLLGKGMRDFIIELMANKNIKENQLDFIYGTDVPPEGMLELFDMLNDIQCSIEFGKLTSAFIVLRATKNKELAKLLANVGVSYNSFTILKEQTSYSEQQIIQYIKELGLEAFEGQDIVRQIIEYSALSQRLKDVFGRTVVNNNEPIGVSLYSCRKAVRVYDKCRLDIKQALQEMYYDYKNVTGAIFQSFDENISFREATLQEALDHVLFLPKRSILLSRPMIIYKDLEQIGLVFFTAMGPFLLGCWDDDVKKAVNNYLDLQEFNSSGEVS